LPSDDAASCPTCSARYEHLLLTDARGRPRELRCTGCGASFYAATCPACHARSTQLELAPGRRRHKRRPHGVDVLRQVRCSDCGHVWLLRRRAGLRDLASPSFWRTRLGTDDAPRRRLDEERSDLSNLLLRGLVGWVVIMPVVGFALFGLLVLMAPLVAVAVGARSLWTSHPLLTTGLALLAAGIVVALYMLARRRLVDSALARAYVAAINGPVPVAAIAVVLFVHGVGSAG
jgi:hypothetical protein